MLTVDYKGIQDWEKVVYDDCGLKPVTQIIVYASMLVHMNTITKDNYHEFWLRFKVLDILTPGGYSESLTLDDIRDHIGIKLNVISSKSAWNKQVNRTMKETIAWFKKEDERDANP